MMHSKPQNKVVRSICNIDEREPKIIAAPDYLLRWEWEAGREVGTFAAFALRNS